MSNSRGKLALAASHPSGPVPAGSNLSHWLHRDGNPDDVPDTGLQWEYYINGVLANFADLSRISQAPAVLHTFNRRFTGILLRPDWKGQLEVRGYGHDLDQRWAYLVGKAVAPDPSVPPTGWEEEVRDIIRAELEAAFERWMKD